MASEKYKPSKQELLSELESIWASLHQDPDFNEPLNNPPAPENNIPVLLNSVLDDVEEVEFGTMLENQEQSHKKAENQSPKQSDNINTDKPLPGQQSLFNPASDKPKPKESTHDTTDNPFLPRHIRERLNQNKNALVDELAQVGETLGKSNANQNMPKESSQEIVDSLVAKYLPIIENELRVRLKSQLDNLEKNPK